LKRKTIAESGKMYLKALIVPVPLLGGLEDIQRTIPTLQTDINVRAAMLDVRRRTMEEKMTR